VASSVFAGVDYVALGHLHRPQDLAPVNTTRLRYCGSPLRYSFSEADQVKSVTIVDLGARGVEAVWEVPIEQPRAMANLRGLMDELLDPQLYSWAADAWVSLTVIDDRRPSQMWQRLQDRFPHALQVRHEPQTESALAMHSPRREQKPLEVAADFVQYVTNAEITADETAAFDCAVQAVRGREQG
jgi:exonuclease SbcD